MRSRTSFFNKTLFLKNVTRFWPVWGTYLGVWTLLLPVGLLSGRGNGDDFLWVSRYVLQVCGFGGVIMSAVFAVLMAMAVWSFLYSTRACSGAACLPLRRETQFVSVTLAGLLPLMASNVLVTVLLGLAELYLGVFRLLPLLEGLAAAWLSLLFFYGFASLCAQLTGSIVVLPAVYAVLNFTAYVVELLVRAICSVFVFGLDDPTVSALGQCLSPMVRMLERVDVVCTYSDEGKLTAVTASGWGCLAIYAGVGLLLLCCALLLLRRRRMESAGDVVAVNVLKPIFRWCMALGCALCLACILLFLFDLSYRIENQWVGLAGVLVLLLAGAFVGWFAGEMLIRKSFRVFRRGWGGFGICCLVIAVLTLGMELDLFGTERRIPPAERIASIMVYGTGKRTDLSAPENVEAVRALHRGILAEKTRYEAPWKPGEDSIPCTLEYTLKNGESFLRSYSLRYDADVPETYGPATALEAVLNSPEARAQRNQTEFPFTSENIFDAWVNSVLTLPECAAAEGLDSPEAYIFLRMGLTDTEIAAMSEEARTYAINKFVIENAANGYVFDGDSNDSVPAAPIDLTRVRMNYEWHLTEPEAAELYETCLLPELADGSLGTVRLIQDSAAKTKDCACTVYLEGRQEYLFRAEENGTERKYTDCEYDSLRLTLQTDALRTMAWLRSHGIVFHTEAETGALE